ncbi:MAG: DNA-3-methyladenine glycosylase family protein [Bacteroidota bacterium]
MATNWILPSTPPHDWFLCLDIDQYFDHEHDPEKIFEDGFTRPLPVGDRDTIVSIYFNGDPEQPEFHIECPEKLNKQEIETANRHLARILGTDLDLKPLYEQADNDELLSPLFTELYGLKRMARATFFEDAINRIIEMRLSHKPTAKRMVYDVREQYGSIITLQGNSIPSWPRPHQLIKADPQHIRELGPTKRKGEFIIGLAHQFVSGNLDMQQLDQMSPTHFYDSIKQVRGIGPTSAQQLMLFRPQSAAVFPSNRQKGVEKGLRKWIIMSYGGNPDQTDEDTFQQMISNWKGYEAMALEHLFVNWVLSEKEKKREKSS